MAELFLFFFFNSGILANPFAQDTFCRPSLSTFFSFFLVVIYFFLNMFDRIFCREAWPPCKK